MVAIYRLLGKNTESCGCLREEMRPNLHLTHGYSDTRLYGIWNSMIQRCTNPNVKAFKDYGGRGIRVCDKWLNSFEDFLADIGERPSLKHSLDRYPNNDGNYEPGNVRWATTQEQSRNKRDNHWLEYKGEIKIFKDWTIQFGLNRGNLFRMLKKKTFEECMDYYLSKQKYKPNDGATSPIRSEISQTDPKG